MYCNPTYIFLLSRLYTLTRKYLSVKLYIRKNIVRRKIGLTLHVYFLSFTNLKLMSVYLHVFS